MIRIIDGYRCACLLMLIALVASMACNDEQRPSYQELKTRNEELESQLASVNEKIHDAQSELQDLKLKIDDVESDPCHEDSASDLSGQADSVDSDLDDAENESQ